MASQSQKSLYPEIDQSNPNHSPLYPSLDMKDLIENLFPEDPGPNPNYIPSAPPEKESHRDTIIRLPGAILHLIDKHYSVELAYGELKIVQIRQEDNIIAVLASVGNEIQWPLAKDEAIVKLDDSRYFFSFRALPEPGYDWSDDDKKRFPTTDDNNVLNYGLTIASKGQKDLLKALDGILDKFGSFSVQKVSEKVEDFVGMEISPDELESKGKEMVEGKCAVYWTTLAPNVEEYSSVAGKLIASGSGQLIKGILWCGDVTVDRLKWGNEVMKKRMVSGSKSEVSPETLKRIKRVKRMSKMTEKVATGVLTGVVRVSGFFTSSVANSKVGKKFFGLLPGEIVLASLDGFNKVCDAVEVTGRNVMATSSTVTTGLVSHRYGEEAAMAAGEGLDAAGHAIETAWTVFKIRKAMNPKSVLKPTNVAKTMAKCAASHVKAKSSK